MNEMGQWGCVSVPWLLRLLEAPAFLALAPPHHLQVSCRSTFKSLSPSLTPGSVIVFLTPTLLPLFTKDLCDLGVIRPTWTTQDNPFTSNAYLNYLCPVY